MQQVKVQVPTSLDADVVFYCINICSEFQLVCSFVELPPSTLLWAGLEYSKHLHSQCPLSFVQKRIKRSWTHLKEALLKTLHWDVEGFSPRHISFWKKKNKPPNKLATGPSVCFCKQKEKKKWMISSSGNWEGNVDRICHQNRSNFFIACSCLWPKGFYGGLPL